MADKTVIEGEITNVSATKHSIEINGKWYKFSNKDWEANQSDVNKGSNCRFETSSSTREYQGKTYETNWVNGFNPLTDLDDAPMDLDFSEEEDAPEPTPPSASSSSASTSSKLIKALGVTDTSLSIITQVAFKEVYTPEYLNTDVDELAKDVANAAEGMLRAMYLLKK